MPEERKEKFAEKKERIIEKSKEHSGENIKIFVLVIFAIEMPIKYLIIETIYFTAARSLEAD